MSLTKTAHPVVFKGGLDQKTATKLVVEGSFLALENCVRRKRGAIQKRYGFTALGSRIFGTSDTVVAGNHIDVFNDDVIALANEKLYSYSPANDKWVDKGTCSIAQVTLMPIIRTSATQAMADHAYNAGLVVAAYEDSTGGVRYSVYDDTTGSALIYNALVDAAGSRPKVVAVRNGFVLGYMVADTILTRAIAIGIPMVIGAPNTVVGAGVGDAPWDMDVYSSYAFFAFYNGATISVGYIDQTGAVGSPAANGLPAVTAIAGTGAPTDALSVVADAANNKLWVIYYGAGVGVVRVLALSVDFATTAVRNVQTIANTRNVTGVVRAADGYLRVYYEQSQSSVKDHYVSSALLSWSGSGAISSHGSATVFKRSVGLASKSFEVGGRQYVNLSHDSSLQPTYFTVRDDGFIVARILGGSAGGHSRDASNALKSGLPRIIVDGEGRYATIAQVRNTLNIDNGGTILATSRGIEKAAIAFGAELYGRTLGKNYHIVGGATLNYDGVAVTEHGFYIFPEDVSGASVAGATAFVAADVISCRVIYEYIDGKGLIHRSAPSTTVPTTVGVDSHKITITVPTLRVTNKTAASVNVVIYTAPKGTTTTYYRYSSTANDATASTLAIDITTDATASGEILYTTGGILENIAPPAAKCIHSHKSRLFLGGTEDGLIYFSKSQVPEEGIGFQDAIPVRMEADGGEVRAFATLDDKLIIFKDERIYYLSGEGPTDAGAQNDYFVPLKIASDVGTALPRSVAVLPDGVIFKSAKGFMILSRALGLLQVGEPVTDYDGLTVTSAAVLTDEQEVRFTTSDGVCLIYNYHFKQWSTFANYEAVSAVTGLATYLHMKADGTVNREVVDSYSDNGSRISMTIETSWLALAGLQGYQRIYKALLLGDFLSHHYSQIKVAYDYEDAYSETINFNTQIGLNSSSVYGEGATYGAATPYGGTGSSVYQFRLQPARQKCEAMKLRITDQDTIGDVAGGSFVLVAMTLEVGRKYGANKLGATKTVGNG